VSQLQEQHGRWLWRWRAPLSDRLGLRLAPAATAASAGSLVTELTAGRADHWPRPHLVTREDAAGTLDERDMKLVEAAAAILREADERGIRLSQMALARRLRALGMSIPNQRLRWLAMAARAEVCSDTKPDGNDRKSRAG
jgi:hypothetical protein